MKAARHLALLLLAASSMVAADASFSRRVWQTADGLPEDFAQAIAQTPDGYLWIGSSGGLVRFDGARFTVYNSQTDPAFHDDSVYSLLVSRDGTVWAGTEGGGLIRLRNGVFRVYGAQEGLTNGFVRAVFEDRSGRIWAGTDRGLFRLENERLVRVDDRGGVHSIAVASICEDRRGRLLVGGNGLLVLDGASASYYQSSETLADNSIRAIREAKDGTIWIGSISGLRRLPGGIEGNPFLAPKIVSGANIAFVAEGRNGDLWIGCYGQGVMRYRGGRMDRFTAPSPLPHNNVLWIFEDAESDIWVGTQGGLLRLSPGAARTITTADGAPQSINAIYQDPRGALFATALNGKLYEVASDGLRPAPMPGRGRGLAHPQRLSGQRRRAVAGHRRPGRHPHRQFRTAALHHEAGAGQRLHPSLLRGPRRQHLDRDRRRRQPLERRGLPQFQRRERARLQQHSRRRARPYGRSLDRHRRRPEPLRRRALRLRPAARPSARREGLGALSRSGGWPLIGTARLRAVPAERRTALADHHRQGSADQ